ncbi:drug/metabolite exporter YedA [Capsulimonas corticalis]|uniref:Drug/metabolite exporter YedA n=1 Tax=Capsulimonas corticalis TaxID=2219043 RepID=A0A402D5A0_9BACT|nr:EamA family transporter [Capsulimonas corticalis]BDI29853.1 drug/metabolite exporter YedA [Capsulimonas corticalis]
MTPEAHPPDTQASRLRIIVALLVTWLAFGSTYFAIKIALREVPPLMIASVNLVGAGAALLAWRRTQVREKLSWGEWRSALLLGALMFFLGRAMVVWGSQFVSSSAAALLSASAPLWVALLGTVFFRERLSPRAILGLFAGFGGMALLVAPSGGEIRLSLTGVVSLTVSALAWATGALLSKRREPSVQPITATAMQMLAGGALVVLASGATGEWGRIHPAHLTFGPVAAVIYITIAVALIGFTTFGWLLRATSAALANTFSFVSPVVAVLLGWAFLHEPLTPRTILASAVILLGVVLMVTAPKPADPASTQMR